MKKIIYCRSAKEIQNRATLDEKNKNLERHIAGCAECRRLQAFSGWMQKLAAQTAAPENLPAPGFLLFKAKLIEKQSAVARAVQPIVWAQIASVAVFASAIVFFLLKSEMPVGGLLKDAFSSLSPVAPLLILSAAGFVLICGAFAYFLRRTQEFKK